MDRLTSERRSALMSKVRGKNTTPEIVVRKLAHRLGFRFRLHRRDLPGSPDIVFPSRRAVIFVHGCFWHGHECSKGRLPKSNQAFWSEKIERNKERDGQNARALRRLGWRVLAIWQCELKDAARVERRLVRFLSTTSA